MIKTLCVCVWLVLFSPFSPIIALHKNTIWHTKSAMSGGHCHSDLPTDCALLGWLRATGGFNLKFALELRGWGNMKELLMSGET